jgi:hypothetical protein
LKAKRDWMSTVEVAGKIGYSERTVRRLGDAGAIRFKSLGEHGWRRYSIDSVDAFLRRQKNGHGGAKK